MKKQSKRDKAGYLGVDNSTLYNWRRFKPNLYRIVMLGFEFDALLSQQKSHFEALAMIDDKIKAEIKHFGGELKEFKNFKADEKSGEKSSENSGENSSANSKKNG